MVEANICIYTYYRIYAMLFIYKLQPYFIVKIQLKEFGYKILCMQLLYYYQVGFGTITG